jgi:signal transduction histidine kinase
MPAAARRRPAEARDHPRDADASLPVGEHRNVGREQNLRRAEASLGDTLTRIARLSQGALRDPLDPSIVETIDSIHTLAVEGLEDLRSAREAIARDGLRSKDLPASLRSLVRTFELETRIPVDLRIPARAGALSDEIAWALYAVADEVLHGLGRLSRATGVVVGIQATHDTVSLSIRDDGVGLLERQGAGWRASPHVTLRAIRRTIDAVAGGIRVRSLMPRGLLVTAAVPLDGATR